MFNFIFTWIWFTSFGCGIVSLIYDIVLINTDKSKDISLLFWGMLIGVAVGTTLILLLIEYITHEGGKNADRRNH